MSNILDAYDNLFYKEMSKSSMSSARFLVPFLMENLEFSSVIDIGCGDGQFVGQFIQHGIPNVKGIEGKWILDSLDKSAATWLEIADLTEELIFDSRFDLAICLEVAEHLEEEYADTLIRNLTSASDIVVFSAAIPGQGGTNHVNLQYPIYWAKKFAKHGYFVAWDPRKSLWGNKEVAPWYQQNCLVYKKCEDVNKDLVTPPSLKHPEIFPELQSTWYKARNAPIRVLKKFIRVF